MSLHIYIVLETVCLKQYDHVSILDDIVLTRVSYLCRLILHPPLLSFLISSCMFFSVGTVSFRAFSTYLAVLTFSLHLFLQLSLSLPCLRPRPNPSRCNFFFPSPHWSSCFSPSFSIQFNSTYVISERAKRRIAKTNRIFSLFFLIFFYIPLPPCVRLSAQVCGSLCLMPAFGVIAIGVLGGGQSRCRWD